MNRYILISSLFFVCFLFAQPPVVYSDHCGETTTTPSETATVPNTQTTSNMDIYKPGSSDPLSPTSPFDAFYFDASAQEGDVNQLKVAEDILKGMSDALMATQGLEWNEAAADYLPPGAVPDPERVRKVEASRLRSIMPPTSSDSDRWDFLPGYTPPDPYAITAEFDIEKFKAWQAEEDAMRSVTDPAFDRILPSQHKDYIPDKDAAAGSGKKAPAASESSESGNTQDAGFDLDIIVH